MLCVPWVPGWGNGLAVGTVGLRGTQICSAGDLQVDWRPAQTFPQGQGLPFPGCGQELWWGQAGDVPHLSEGKQLLMGTCIEGS